MNIKEEFKDRVDPVRYKNGLTGADFLAKNFIPDGRYIVDESWGPEGVLYLAESSWALMDAYRISGNQLYIDAVVAILNELKRTQKPSGGWAICLGKNGICFKASDEERADSIEFEDPPTTAAFLRTISEYQELTGDNSFFYLGEKAFNYLIPMWNPDARTFIDTRKRKLLGLRSNPNGYHLFFLIGVHFWKNHEPEICANIYPALLDFVKSNFEGFDINTMPLICALHAAVLMDHCTFEYIQTIIKPKIDTHLVNNDIFKIPEIPGGYGHRDGSRGIVLTEVHMRSCAGIAIAMKKFDLVSNTNTYRDSTQYQLVANWIDGMKTEKFFYEIEFLPERTKRGFGSPGQYLPCWWILGKM